MTTDAAAIRDDLARYAEHRRAVERSRDTLVAAGNDAGIPKTELASLTGLSRQAIYDILAKAAEREQAADGAAVAEVQAMWTRGQVIEDRWGLRWRADNPVSSPNQEMWQCRSVGLKIWRAHEKMAERGPLKTIRVDLVLAGEKAQAARKAGEVEDSSVVVEPHEDPEP